MEERALVSFRIEAASSRIAATKHAFYDVQYRAHRTRSLTTLLSTIRRRDRRSSGIVVRLVLDERKDHSLGYTQNCFIADGVSSTLNGNTNAGCEEQLYKWIISSVREPFELISFLLLLLPA